MSHNTLLFFRSRLFPTLILGRQRGPERSSDQMAMQRSHCSDRAPPSVDSSIHCEIVDAKGARRGCWDL